MRGMGGDRERTPQFSWGAFSIGSAGGPAREVGGARAAGLKLRRVKGIAREYLGELERPQPPRKGLDPLSAPSSEELPDHRAVGNATTS